MNYIWDGNTIEDALDVDPASADRSVQLEVGSYALISDVACWMIQGDSTVTATADATAEKRVFPGVPCPFTIDWGKKATLDYLSVIGVSGGAVGKAQIVRHNPAYPLP